MSEGVSKPGIVIASSNGYANNYRDHLSKLGWTPVPLDKPISTTTLTPTAELAKPFSLQEALFSASKALLDDAQKFFSQAEEDKKRCETWKVDLGEKEYIDLRSSEQCPDILQESSKRYWGLLGTLSERTLREIELSLGMGSHTNPGEKDPIRELIGPCTTMPTRQEDQTASVLQLCRYEAFDGRKPALQHVDFGLLNVIMSSSPGLEVRDGDRWISVEGGASDPWKKEAYMLVGRQLQRLSNGRYPACWYRVANYNMQQSEAASEDRRRLSIVFSLRAHPPVQIVSKQFETEVTGDWDFPIHGRAAGSIFEQDGGKCCDAERRWKGEGTVYG